MEKYSTKDNETLREHAEKAVHKAEEQGQKAKHNLQENVQKLKDDAQEAVIEAKNEARTGVRQDGRQDRRGRHEGQERRQRGCDQSRTPGSGDRHAGCKPGPGESVIRRPAAQKKRSLKTSLFLCCGRQTAPPLRRNRSARARCASCGRDKVSARRRSVRRSARG